MNNNARLKQSVIQSCLDLLNEKKTMLQTAMRSLQDALENESKSSAGDKYETGIEMIQLEKEKITNQLNVLEANFKLLNGAINSSAKDQIQNGAMVTTNTVKYFIGPSIGKVIVQDESVYVISPSSPIVQALLHKKVGDKVVFNGQEIEVVEVE